MLGSIYQVEQARTQHEADLSFHIFLFFTASPSLFSNPGFGPEEPQGLDKWKVILM